MAKSEAPATCLHRSRAYLIYFLRNFHPKPRKKKNFHSLKNQFKMVIHCGNNPPAGLTAIVFLTISISKWCIINHTNGQTRLLRPYYFKNVGSFKVTVEDRSLASLVRSRCGATANAHNRQVYETQRLCKQWGQC